MKTGAFLKKVVLVKKGETNRNVVRSLYDKLRNFTLKVNAWKFVEYRHFGLYLYIEVGSIDGDVKDIYFKVNFIYRVFLNEFVR